MSVANRREVKMIPLSRVNENQWCIHTGRVAVFVFLQWVPRLLCIFGRKETVGIGQWFLCPWKQSYVTDRMNTPVLIWRMREKLKPPSVCNTAYKKKFEFRLPIHTHDQTVAVRIDKTVLRIKVSNKSLIIILKG